MKSEELFFEDLNFFRFFSLRLQKNAPSLFHLFFFFFRFFFSLCVGREHNNKKKRRLFRELVVSKKLS
jgi:hypothetical protein